VIFLISAHSLVQDKEHEPGPDFPQDIYLIYFLLLFLISVSHTVTHSHCHSWVIANLFILIALFSHTVEEIHCAISKFNTYFIFGPVGRRDPQLAHWPSKWNKLLPNHDCSVNTVCLLFITLHHKAMDLIGFIWNAAWVFFNLFCFLQNPSSTSTENYNLSFENNSFQASSRISHYQRSYSWLAWVFLHVNKPTQGRQVKPGYAGVKPGKISVAPVCSLWISSSHPIIKIL